jgi:hypothetical protein
MLQSLSDIQRQLKHGFMVNNVDKPNTKGTQISHEIQKHGPENGNTRRSTSKKAQHGSKMHIDVKGFN